EDRERQARLVDAAEKRAQAAEERARQLHEIQLYLQGYRPTAPTRPATDVPDVARGQRLGLACGAGHGEENPLLRGVRLTPAGVTFDPNRRLLTAAVPLAAARGEMTRPGPDEPPRLRALPGAFVPDLGGFTDRPLFEQPMLISSQLRGGGI